MSIWISTALWRLFYPATTGVTTPLAAHVANGYSRYLAGPRKRRLFRNRATDV